MPENDDSKGKLPDGSKKQGEPEIDDHQEQQQLQTQAQTQSSLTLDDAVKELEKVRKALKDANKEAATHRHKANELDALKQKDLSDFEKLQAKYSELEKIHSLETKSNQEVRVNYEVKLQAASLGIVDPEVAAKLIDWAEIEYDEGGMPTNIDDLLKRLAKEKPYLVGSKQHQQNGGATNPSRASFTTNDVGSVLAKLNQGKLSAEEYAALSVDMKEKLQQGMGRRR